jgi:uncharacterized protein (TIRG00374 family)
MMSATPPLSGPRPPRTTARFRDRLFVGGLIALVLLGLAGLAAATGWEETWGQIRRLALGQTALLLALSLANYALRALRWHLYTRALGLPAGFLRDLRHYLGGFAMIVTPGRLGELVRLRWLARETGAPLERIAPLALADRAADLAAMALLLASATLLATGAVKGAVPVAALALLAAIIATRPALFRAFVTWSYRATGLAPRLFARARRAAAALAVLSRGGVLLPALALGMAGWAAEGYAFHLLLAWFGADIGLATAMAIFLCASLAGGLTGAPGGVGGAEAAMIALLALDGVPLETSVAATAIIRVTTLWFAVALGLIAFPLAERQSPKAAP